MLKEPAAGYGVVPLDQARTLDGLALMTGVMNAYMVVQDAVKDTVAEAVDVFRNVFSTIGQVIADTFGESSEPMTGMKFFANVLTVIKAAVESLALIVNSATLLDSVMGCCIHTMLKAGSGYTTVEIKVNYVRAMTHKTGKVRAEGKVINVGSRIATSEGRLVDSAGKLLAHGTTTCLIFPI